MKRYNFNHLREYGVQKWITEENEYGNGTLTRYGYESCTETEEEFTKLTHECECSYQYLQISADYVIILNLKLISYILNFQNAFKVRFIFELILWISSVAYLIMIGSELYIQKLRIFLKNLLFNPSKVFLILSLVCTLLVIPMRYSCQTYGEDVLIVLSIVFKSTYILYLGR